MSVYYNENDPYAAQWLRNLIAAGHLPAGVVDDRSIKDVQPEDLEGFTQCHFFAGIGGWPLALRMAGWPDERPVWTGSCPCQPFSGAGKQQGEKDARHLWPDFLRLIVEWDVPTIFGEQVASALGREWLVGISADLEGLDYVVGAADLCAAGVGAPHIRQRLFWVADANQGQCRRLSNGQECERNGATAGRQQSNGITAAGGLTDRLADDDDKGRSQFAQHNGGTPAGSEIQHRADLDGRSNVRGLADADGRLARNGRLQPGRQHGQQPQDGGAGGLGYAECAEGARQRQHGGRLLSEQETKGSGLSGDADRLGDAERPGLSQRKRDARDAREMVGTPPRQGLEQAGADDRNFWSDYYTIACSDGKTRRAGSGIQPLAHGVPNRVGRLRAYGNAIVPQVAAAFIKAYEETRTKSY